MPSMNRYEPDGLLPMRPTHGIEPFDSPRHIFELKWAGIRALAHLEGGRLRLTSQSGRDISAWFPELSSMARQVRSNGVVLDGEIVALGPNDEPDLGVIAPRLSGAGTDDGQICLFQAYDILREDGLSWLDRPLIERKDALASVIRQTGPAVLTDYVPGDGLALFEAASERRLPGIVAKTKASPYRPGETSEDWVDVSCFEIGEFVIGGYVLGTKGEAPVAGLLLGESDPGGRLQFAAYLQGGFDGERLERVLAPYTAPVCPFATAPAVARLVYWLKPEQVCQVKFARREADGRLRFPVFVTMRPDLDAPALRRDAAHRRSSPGR